MDTQSNQDGPMTITCTECSTMNGEGRIRMGMHRICERCTFGRLRNEHHILYELIDQLETSAMRLRRTEEPAARMERLKELKQNTLNLLTELDEHAEWEDTELFPLLTECFRLPSRPETTTSLWMLEKEHELAATYFRFFLTEVDRCFTESNKAGIEQCTEHLLQACRLVKEHLRMEEETLFPLEEELKRT